MNTYSNETDGRTVVPCIEPGTFAALRANKNEKSVIVCISSSFDINECITKIERMKNNQCKLKLIVPTGDC